MYFPISLMDKPTEKEFPGFLFMLPDNKENSVRNGAKEIIRKFIDFPRLCSWSIATQPLQSVFFLTVFLTEVEEHQRSKVTESL